MRVRTQDHSPKFAGAAKGFCKGDNDYTTKKEIESLQAASRQLMNLFQGDSVRSVGNDVMNVLTCAHAERITAHGYRRRGAGHCQARQWRAGARPGQVN
jgi:hypothetical protein